MSERDVTESSRVAAPACAVSDEATPSLRQSLTSRGWRQGVLLPPELYPHVRMQPFGPCDTPENDSYCIVISQECDLVHDTTHDEPTAEVIVGEAITAIDKSRIGAKHPRELHVELEGPDNGRQVLRILPSNRGWIPRERLAAADPRRDWKLRAGHLDWIIAFLGNRYERTAFPDEFEKRAAQLRKELKGITKQFPVIHQFLIDVDPIDEERPPGKPYTVRIAVVLTDESMQGNGDKLARLEADVRKKVLQAAGRTKGISCEEVTVAALPYLYVGDVQGKVEFDV